MSSSDFDCCLNENARKCEDAQDKPACGDTSRLDSMSDLNNNSVQITTCELVASTTERLSKRKDKSVAEKEQNGEEVSGKNKEESCGTTLDKPVTLVAKSGQETKSQGCFCISFLM